jgi:uncharacterized protein YneF (UPF0154 family)
MKELDKNKVGLIAGIFLGLWHTVWSLFVLIGFAQTILDWIFWLHMVVNPYTVKSFSITTAILLIVVTFIVGYIGGFVFAALWNNMHRKK